MIIIYYFLDTCIKIGYVFCTDPWNKKSVKLFNRKDTFYYSYCVNEEFNKKFNQILKEQKNFFYSLRDDLRLEEPSKKLSFNDLKIKSLIVPLTRNFDENKKKEIVEIIWKYSKNKHVYCHELKKDVCCVKDLLIYINMFNRNFEKVIIDKKREFEQEAIQYSKRDEQYMELNMKLSDIGIHYPDNEIILDAHDISLNENISIEFITTDNKMIGKVNNIINLLNINKFNYLKTFIV